jgi:hypothetical protein
MNRHNHLALSLRFFESLAHFSFLAILRGFPSKSIVLHHPGYVFLLTTMQELLWYQSSLILNLPAYFTLFSGFSLLGRIRYPLHQSTSRIEYLYWSNHVWCRISQWGVCTSLNNTDTTKIMLWHVSIECDNCTDTCAIPNLPVKFVTNVIIFEVMWSFKL